MDIVDNSAISVLLVDDEEMIRDCVSAYLEDEGFSVYAAATGEEALEMMIAVCPAVCISDMRLPGMNGDEFIIRAHKLCSTTVYLLHTGTLYSLSEELGAIGMANDDVLLKPIHDLSKLVHKIRQVAAAGIKI